MVKVTPAEVKRLAGTGIAMLGIGLMVQPIQDYILGLGGAAPILVGVAVLGVGVYFFRM